MIEEKELQASKNYVSIALMVLVLAGFYLVVLSRKNH